ncbi:MAG: hypothetical protein KA712_07615 [Myxococcales bacterium]|nr:hypothetical protein [Myxococcales bacterium]
MIPCLTSATPRCPPPPADLTDEAATETRLTPVPPPEDDAGYSVVSSVKPMAPLTASRRPWAALAGGALLLLGGGVVAFHTDGRPPQARPAAPRSALPTSKGASLLSPAAAPPAPAPEPPAVSEAPQEPEPGLTAKSRLAGAERG